ncbi:MAG: DUF4386 family protein [Chloroflexi bacterium]|jgi:hypothetical protein|nr:MAG: hypothetical protein UZ13_01389 [Chloroflexi bacterium OLB13]MBW7880599.1 DUF4386 family protein [Anaerolineae bacterium]MCC6565380.1 DUF4386 family protein [Chloroflexota bacterium]OQY81608.1 MAG: hypothetical protein B6D42_10925 [Anaerolineae bacterium UTCFX5]MCO6443237.1 DUF4386 family protein [Anaerolineae bacterium]
MVNMRLVRMGGYFAIIVGLMQLVGNGLHPPIPADTVEALGVIAGLSYWIPIHVVISMSYFMFIPFVLGAAAAFKDQGSPFIIVAKYLVIVGAGLGAAQILTHLTYFKYLADQYALADPALQQNIIFSYESFWPYNVALEIAHLVAIFVAVSLFGMELLRDDVLPRWLAWLGIAAGIAATVGILAGKIIFNNDIVFGVSLPPLLIWILAVGVNLLRLKPPASASAGD